MVRIEPQRVPVRAAVLYEKDEFREPLRAALAAAGASIRGEFRISQIKPEDLGTIDAAVLLVNLEPILTGKPELLEALVNGAFHGSIVFNDAEATSNLAGSDMARWARHLASKIMGGNGLPPPPQHDPGSIAEPIVIDGGERDFELWVLAASIGGPEAVRGFLANLKQDIPYAFILVQHIGQEFIDLMAEQLNRVSPIPVRCAVDGEQLGAGMVLVVPADSKLTITQQNRVHLEPLHDLSFSPCINQVLIDASDRFGADTNAIIFSGMSNDGVDGAAHVIERGGEVWVQDPETCVVSSIVEGALKTGKVGFTGTPRALADRMTERAENSAECYSG